MSAGGVDADNIELTLDTTPFGKLPEAQDDEYGNLCVLNKNDQTYSENKPIGFIKYNNKDYVLYVDRTKQMKLCVEIGGEIKDSSYTFKETNILKLININLDNLLEKKNANGPLETRLNKAYPEFEGTFTDEEGNIDITWLILVISGIITEEVWGEAGAAGEAGEANAVDVVSEAGEASDVGAASDAGEAGEAGVVSDAGENNIDEVLQQFNVKFNSVKVREFIIESRLKDLNKIERLNVTGSTRKVLIEKKERADDSVRFYLAQRKSKFATLYKSDDQDKYEQEKKENKYNLIYTDESDSASESTESASASESTEGASASESTESASASESTEGASESEGGSASGSGGKTKTRKPTKITQFPPESVKEKFGKITEFRNKIEFLRKKNLFTNDFRFEGKIEWKNIFTKMPRVLLFDKPPTWESSLFLAYENYAIWYHWYEELEVPEKDRLNLRDPFTNIITEGQIEAEKTRLEILKISRKKNKRNEKERPSARPSAEQIAEQIAEPSKEPIAEPSAKLSAGSSAGMTVTFPIPLSQNKAIVDVLLRSQRLRHYEKPLNDEEKNKISEIEQREQIIIETEGKGTQKAPIAIEESEGDMNLSVNLTSLQDLLKPGTMIKAEIIDQIMDLINKSREDSEWFFFTTDAYNEIKAQKNIFENVDEQKQLYYFPINDAFQDTNSSGCHFFAVTYNKKTSTLEYLNSLETLGQKQEIIDYYKRKLKEKDLEVTEVKQRRVPRQRANSNDCGIFVCMFAIFASDPYVKDGLSLQLINPDKMNLFRKRLALYIMERSIDGIGGVDNSIIF